MPFPFSRRTARSLFFARSVNSSPKSGSSKISCTVCAIYAFKSGEIFFRFVVVAMRDSIPHCFLSHLPGLNWGPRLYERRALPTELRWLQLSLRECSPEPVRFRACKYPTRKLVFFQRLEYVENTARSPSPFQLSALHQNIRVQGS